MHHVSIFSYGEEHFNYFTFKIIDFLIYIYFFNYLFYFILFYFLAQIWIWIDSADCIWIRVRVDVNLYWLGLVTITTSSKNWTRNIWASHKHLLQWDQTLLKNVWTKTQESRAMLILLPPFHWQNEGEWRTNAILIKRTHHLTWN